MSCPFVVSLRARRPLVASLRVASFRDSKNSKIQRATVANNRAGARRIKQVI